MLSCVLSDSSFEIFFQLTCDHTFEDSRPLARDTRKMGCPASITIRDIVLFPQLKVSFPETEWNNHWPGLSVSLTTTLKVKHSEA